MPKKKTSDKALVPVHLGDVFRAFVVEAMSVGNEVEARRAFDADVGEYLELKALTADFNAWREAKHAPKA